MLLILLIVVEVLIILLIVVKVFAIVMMEISFINSHENFNLYRILDSGIVSTQLNKSLSWN